MCSNFYKRDFLQCFKNFPERVLSLKGIIQIIYASKMKEYF